MYISNTQGEKMMRIYFNYPGLEKYKEYLENQGLKEHTISDYMYYMNRFINNHGKPEILNDKQIEDILIDMARDKHNYYNSPIRYSLVSYLLMLDRKYIYDKIRYTNRRLLAYRGRKEDIDRFLTSAELNILFNGLNTNIVTISKILYETASRISEVLELKPKDIDYTNNTITLTVKKKIQNVSKIRSLSANTIAELKTVISTKKLTPEDYIFRMGLDVFNTILRRASKRLIGKAVSSHYFRATKLTEIALKYGIVKAQKLAEHTSIMTTQKYISRKLSEVTKAELDNVNPEVKL